MTKRSSFFLAIVLGLAPFAKATPPPIFQAHETILFQGDSITDAGRNRSGFYSLGGGYPYLISAEYGSQYPNLQLTFLNRGVSGNTIPQMAQRWQNDCLDLNPDVLSILIGINDVADQLRSGKPFDAEVIYSEYDKLLGDTIKARPNLKIILCEPFVIAAGHVARNYETWSKDTQEADLAVEKLGAKYLLPVVRLQQVFDQASQTAPAGRWSSDGIHPNAAGQELMAEAWVEAYKNFYLSPLLDSERNPAIDPVVNRERDSYDWLHRHDDVLDQQAKINPDIVMIGDSITNYWGGLPKAETTVNGPQSWADTFGSLNVLNMGFGWDRTQNVLWRMNHGEFEGISPKSVVINIGTNNLVGDYTARTDSPAEIAVGIQAIVNLVHQRSPSSHIFVMGVFPRGFDKGNGLDRRITILNQILAKNLHGATLLDIGPELREPDGSISRKNFLDGTHPTERGYEIWGRALKKAGAIP